MLFSFQKWWCQKWQQDVTNLNALGLPRDGGAHSWNWLKYQVKTFLVLRHYCNWIQIYDIPFSVNLKLDNGSLEYSTCSYKQVTTRLQGAWDQEFTERGGITHSSRKGKGRQGKVCSVLQKDIFCQCVSYKILPKLLEKWKGGGMGQ